jgi:hypothetical protein
MPSVPMSLNQVSCPCARARANRSTLPAANQPAAHRARDAANNGTFGPAMVMTPPLNGEACARECDEQQSNTQEHYNYAFT